MSVKEEGGIGTIEKEKTDFKKPPMYNTIMLNDDFTPMEFVTWSLVEHFKKPVEQAIQVMLKVHNEGKAVAGTYAKDVAHTISENAMAAAKKAGHPLQVIIEPA